MLTLFSTPKPFRGHIGVIQRNALKSWTLLHPDVEIILFGDDEGTADICRELGLQHEPHVERSASRDRSALTTCSVKPKRSPATTFSVTSIAILF